MELAKPPVGQTASSVLLVRPNKGPLLIKTSGSELLGLRLLVEPPPALPASPTAPSVPASTFKGHGPWRMASSEPSKRVVFLRFPSIFT